MPAIVSQNTKRETHVVWARPERWLLIASILVPSFDPHLLRRAKRLARTRAPLARLRAGPDPTGKPCINRKPGDDPPKAPNHRSAARVGQARLRRDLALVIPILVGPSGQAAISRLDQIRDRGERRSGRLSAAAARSIRPSLLGHRRKALAQIVGVHDRHELDVSAPIQKEGFAGLDDLRRLG